jgi:predicted small secreted protein
MAKQGFKVAPAFTRALSGLGQSEPEALILLAAAAFFRWRRHSCAGRFHEGNQMIRPAFAAILLLSLSTTLTSCGNTARGLAQDGRDTSHALDNATHRVLGAGSKK